jgi:hypothetical protein
MQKPHWKAWNWRDRSTGVPSYATSCPAPKSRERELASSDRATLQKKGAVQTPDEEFWRLHRPLPQSLLSRQCCP